MRESPSDPDLLSELVKTTDHLSMLVRQIMERRQNRPIERSEEKSLALAEAIVSARRERHRHFSAGLFHDPAWDILLHVYVAQASEGGAPLKRIAHATQLPPTTVLTWLKTLELRGFVSRDRAQDDKRRLFVRLTMDGAARMQSWLAFARLEAMIPDSAEGRERMPGTGTRRVAKGRSSASRGARRGDQFP